jgi:hypothetical protein
MPEKKAPNKKPHSVAECKALNIAHEVDRMRTTIAKTLGACQMHEFDHQAMIELQLWLLVSVNLIEQENNREV